MERVGIVEIVGRMGMVAMARRITRARMVMLLVMRMTRRMKMKMIQLMSKSR